MEGGDAALTAATRRGEADAPEEEARVPEREGGEELQAMRGERRRGGTYWGSAAAWAEGGRRETGRDGNSSSVVLVTADSMPGGPGGTLGGEGGSRGKVVRGDGWWESGRLRGDAATEGIPVPIGRVKLEGLQA